MSRAVSGRGRTLPEAREARALTVALMVALGSFAFAQTMVLPAIPYFEREFAVSPTWASWIISVYLISSSVLTPILGSLGDLYGKRRMLVIALSIFGLATAGASLSWNIESLLVCRGLQGAGGAAFPLTFGIIRSNLPPRRRAPAIGAMSSVFGLAGGLGLGLSGVVLTYLGWRWFFLSGAPVALAAAAFAHRHIRETPVIAGARADYLGAGLLGLALVTLLVALTKGNDWGWASMRVAGLLVLAAVLGVAFAAAERRVSQPMVSRAIMRSPVIWIASISAFLIGFGIFAMFRLVPAYVQSAAAADYGFQVTALAAGVFFVPYSLALVLGGPFGGRVTNLWGPVPAVSAGSALFAAGLGLLALFPDGRALVYGWMALIGAGMGCALTGVGALVVESVDAGQSGVAAALNNITRTIGGVVGAQVTAVLLAAQVSLGAGSADPFEVSFLIAAAAVALAGLAPLLLAGRSSGGARARPDQLKSAAASS